MTDASLRGRCEELSRAAASADPSLRLTSGWYHDPVWGAEEHWWCVAADGSIVDPTAAQFPLGGITEFYEECGGMFPCEQCGREFPIGEGYMGRLCSGECYGRMVGVSV